MRLRYRPLISTCFILAAPVQSRAAEGSAPEVPPIVVPAPRRAELQIDFSLPVSAFALKSLDPDPNNGGLSWNASFTPRFAPQARVAAKFPSFTLAYGRKLANRDKFSSIEASLAVYGPWRIAGHWRDFRGFDEQMSLEDPSSTASNITYDSGRPTYERLDVRFLDRALGLTGRWPVSLAKYFPRVADSDLSADFHVGADAQVQTLFSDVKLIPNDYDEEFGAEAYLRRLRQAAGVFSIGGELRYVSGASIYSWDVGLGLRLIDGYYDYTQGGAEHRFAAGFAATTELGYTYQSAANYFGAQLQFAGALSRVRQLGFSSQFLALRLSYARTL